MDLEGEEDGGGWHGMGDVWQNLTKTKTCKTELVGGSDG